MNHRYTRKDDTLRLSEEKEIHIERIRAYEELAMYKEAIGECRELIRLDPKDPASLVELGVQFDSKGEKEKAFKCFKYAIVKSSQYFRSYVGLGYLFQKHQDRNDMALLCYEKALELNPNDEWALYNIGWLLHYRLGKWKEAVSYFEKSYVACKQEGMKTGRTLHGLGWAYYRLKDFNKAWRIFDLILQLDPDYAEGKNDMWADFGCVNYKLGCYGKALELFEEAVMRQPDNKRYNRLCSLAGEKKST